MFANCYWITPECFVFTTSYLSFYLVRWFVRYLLPPTNKMICLDGNYSLLRTHPDILQLLLSSDTTTISAATSTTTCSTLLKVLPRHHHRYRRIQKKASKTETMIIVQLFLLPLQLLLSLLLPLQQLLPPLSLTGTNIPPLNYSYYRNQKHMMNLLFCTQSFVTITISHLLPRPAKLNVN